ncbi:hypothetical protein Tco_0881681 [Tanacetum coccineum]
MQSSFVSSDFIEKLLNFENVSPADNEIAFLMDTTIRHEEPSSQTSSLFIIPVMVIPKITSAFTTTIPLPPPSFNPLLQQTTPTPTPTASKVTTSFPTLPDFASVFRFNYRVTNLERDLSEMKQFDQYAQAISSIPAIIYHYIDNKRREAIQQAIKSYTAECREEALPDRSEYIDLINTSVRAIIKEESTYEAAASLSEFKLTKILMDKMEEHKSYLRADYKRELYDTLVKSYNTDKDLFDTYGEVFTLKRSRDDKDKDQDPSAGSDRGTKIRKSSKSAHTEEKSHTVNDSGVRQNQEFNMGNNDEQPDNKVISKSDCNISYAEEPRTSFDELMDIPIDFSAFVMNRLNITNVTQELLVGPAFNLLKGTCKSRTELEYHFEEFTSLKIMKWYDYGHLDKIEVRREDQQLYTFKEGDFLRLFLQDIEDMLLLLVQQRLTNLIIEECFDLNVALRMFTRRIVIQRRVEDLQLGVESYRQKLNLSKPYIFRMNLKNRTAYTAYSDP